jgi:hypothetical protein
MKQWARRAAVHPVHMTFIRFEGWICEFTQESIRVPIRVFDANDSVIGPVSWSSDNRSSWAGISWTFKGRLK